MQMCQHDLRYLSKTFKNVELKTLCMTVSVAQVCLIIAMYCVYKQMQHFCSTGVPKISPGYSPDSLKAANIQKDLHAANI